MNDLDYTYAVARIRALEGALFSNSMIEQLVGCKDEQQCLQLLAEKGWGDGNATDAEDVLNCEEEKTWEVIRQIAPDLSVFDVLSYSKVYHNLKAAIKAVCTDVKSEHIFYDDCAISGEEMLDIVQAKEFERLPGQMAQVARNAYETLAQTGDGQLCDVIVDKGALDAIYQAGQESKDQIIKDYAEATVAIADIKIAVRSAKTGKSIDFMQQAMAHCKTISADMLARAAVSGMDAVREYLAQTDYAEGAVALEESASAFERWCDNRMIESIKPQKRNAFSVGPLVAYVIARENEIKTVRVILTGKQNGFSEEAIRERVREMYV